MPRADGCPFFLVQTARGGRGTTRQDATQLSWAAARPGWSCVLGLATSERASGAPFHRSLAWLSSQVDATSPSPTYGLANLAPLGAHPIMRRIMEFGCGAGGCCSAAPAPPELFAEWQCLLGDLKPHLGPRARQGFARMEMQPAAGCSGRTTMGFLLAVAVLLSACARVCSAMTDSQDSEYYHAFTRLLSDTTVLFSHLM